MFREIKPTPRGVGNAAAAPVRAGFAVARAAVRWSAGHLRGRRMPSLEGATAWLNSDPLAPRALRGRVVLVQFWTYSCIEWLGTFPYVRAWAEKYKNKGLVVIGVHTPEYSFEHDVENVRRASKGLGVEYPIAIDNHFAIWDAFKNQYSPALYLVDASGRVRHHHLGEGAYEESERIIQQLLREAGARDVSKELIFGDSNVADPPAERHDAQPTQAQVGGERRVLEG